METILKNAEKIVSTRSTMSTSTKRNMDVEPDQYKILKDKYNTLKALRTTEPEKLLHAWKIQALRKDKLQVEMISKLEQEIVKLKEKVVEKNNNHKIGVDGDSHVNTKNTNSNQKNNSNDFDEKKIRKEMDEKYKKLLKKETNDLQSKLNILKDKCMFTYICIYIRVCVCVYTYISV